MDNLIFVVIMELCSLLFLYLGYLLWKKEKINLVHSYHYTKVTDKKSYTAIMGKAMIIIGIGMMISGLCGLYTDSMECVIPFAVTFLIGICMMTYGQIKYNHGIF